MKEFSKRTTIILDCISLVMFLISLVLILTSASLLPVLQNFIQDKVLHKTLNMAKWQERILQLVAIPAFVTICINALIFYKYSDKNKIFLLSIYLLGISVILIFAFFTRTVAQVDSDMVSELVLAKEGARAKTFWPRTWYYSTEFRLLNTQLVSTILFFFTDKWNIVKALTAVCCMIALFFSELTILKVLKIEKKWLRFLFAIISICPCSVGIWNLVTFGNYYVPHFVIFNVSMALFFDLASPLIDVKSKKYKIYKIIFFTLSFLNGLAGIRYVLILHIPLIVTALLPKINELVKKDEKFSIKTFFFEDPYAFYSTASFIFCALGYAGSSVVLPRLFKFATWNDEVFGVLGEMTIGDIGLYLFHELGYKDNISVLSPSGVVNVMIFVLLVTLFIGIVTYYKKREEQNSNRLFFVTLSLVSLVFMGMCIFVTVTAYRRFLPSLFPFITCFAFLFEDKNFNKLVKYIFGFSITTIFMCGGIFSVQTILAEDKNSDRYAPLDFIKKEGYTFGYASFWNANIFTYMTNGKIEVGDLGGDNVPTMFETYKPHKYLSLSRYYKDDYHAGEKCFLLVQEWQYQKSTHCRLFSLGKEVYSDGNYRVFEYASPEEFRQSF